PEAASAPRGKTPALPARGRATWAAMVSAAPVRITGRRKLSVRILCLSVLIVPKLRWRASNAGHLGRFLDHTGAPVHPNMPGGTSAYRMSAQSLSYCDKGT